MNITRISKYVLSFFFVLALIFLGFNTTPLATNENNDHDVIQSINQYLRSDYVAMYDYDNEYDIESELLKIQQLREDLTNATGLDYKLLQQAQTMLVQLNSAIYNRSLYKADFYVDAYLSTLYETEHAQSHYSDWSLYTMPFEENQQMDTELWNELTEQEKLSFILSMKSILLNQESVQYMPSTFYVLEKLEQSSHDNIANYTVKTLHYH
ncbi:D-alanine--D-alanine ligase [Solibacillus merdavium]|uniref:D-alanine--D-alanine ligase n=1 Tax=Solibacillus merdavium TaxID=2762218 RepID=A0ABR8XMI1_9BACL|nr:D-alanine--D-alanine ligase [Solibacillus merdavium]MBD8033152.1 D-alanine--D-alanine ligase [Solibacillus merdavium]